MTWSGSNRGMLRRLRSHKKRKAGLWSHFSVYEVRDNIRDDEIRELQGLFRHIYRRDVQTNRLNVARGSKTIRKVKVQKLADWHMGYKARILMTLPSRLFKYMSLAGERADWVRSAIVERALYFASVASFNDPFECRFQSSARGTREQWREILSRPEVRDLLRLPRWGALTDYAVDLFAKQASHNASTFAESFRTAIQTKVGVCCFSEMRDNLLMWSHYADGQKGICLEFTPRGDGSLFSDAEPVRYQDEYPAFDYFLTTKEERARLVFLTKSKGWSYESEWRIVDVKMGPRLRHYAMGELTSVVLGPEADSDVEKRVRSWIAESGSGIVMYRAIRRPNSYALEIIGPSQSAA